MGTLYSDIYIDGMNTEILAAEGAQIKEAWLNGECIWKLADPKIQIDHITYYGGMYYAIGSDINSYGNRAWCFLFGKTLDKLTEYPSVLGMSNRLDIERFYADSDGIYQEKNNTYAYGTAKVAEYQTIKVQLINELGTVDTSYNALFMDFGKSGLSKNMRTNFYSSEMGYCFADSESYSVTHIFQNSLDGTGIHRTEINTETENCAYSALYIMGSELLLTYQSNGSALECSYEDYAKGKRLRIPIFKCLNMNFTEKYNIYYDITKYYEEDLRKSGDMHDAKYTALIYESIYIQRTNAIIMLLYAHDNSKGYKKWILLEYRNGRFVEKRLPQEPKDLYPLTDGFIVDYADSRLCAFMQSLESDCVEFALPDDIYHENLGVSKTCRGIFIRGNKLCLNKNNLPVGYIDTYEVDLSSGTVENVIYDIALKVEED
ncbi:MAG: hypothetical protein J6B43_11090 [Lachnospiraceae bacterium]|nr:hypothetical protein [Lachnospiraceae bacterium]